jgi:ABC-type glycerol-3-phosphate transport system permease component
LDFLENPLWLPAKWQFKNLSAMLEYFVVQVNKNGALTNVYIEGMLLNSVLYAAGSAFFSAFTACITAYATARFRFKFNAAVHGIVIVAMTLPIVGSLPSELQFLKALGLYDHIWGQWICKANFLGMYYLVFYGVFKSLSKDITDAAYIDGASNLTVMFRIAMPLAANTFTTVMLILFVGFWNDYTVTITYMPTIPTLAFGLYEYSFSAKPAINNTPMRLMGCLILIVPALILFIAFHKRLMGNISMGGVKE